MLEEAPVACIVQMGAVAFDQDAQLKHCKERLSADKILDRVDIGTRTGCRKSLQDRRGDGIPAA